MLTVKLFPVRYYQSPINRVKKGATLTAWLGRELITLMQSTPGNGTAPEGSRSPVRRRKTEKSEAVEEALLFQETIVQFPRCEMPVTVQVRWLAASGEGAITGDPRNPIGQTHSRGEYFFPAEIARFPGSISLKIERKTGLRALRQGVHPDPRRR